MHHAGIQYGQQASATMSSNHLQQQQVQQPHYPPIVASSATSAALPAINPNNNANVPTNAASVALQQVQQQQQLNISQTVIPGHATDLNAGSTASLRQWRKKDEKSQPDTAPATGEAQAIARVAPHAHYPRANDTYPARYHQYAPSEYAAGLQPFKELSPVKYSEIVEPASHHLSTPVIQKPGHSSSKDKDYMDLCSVVQQGPHHQLQQLQQQVQAQGPMKHYAGSNPAPTMLPYSPSAPKESHVNPYHLKDYAYSSSMPMQNFKLNYNRNHQYHQNDYLSFAPGPPANVSEQLYQYPPNRHAHAHVQQYRNYRNYAVPANATSSVPVGTGNNMQYFASKNDLYRANTYPNPNLNANPKYMQSHQIPFDLRNISPRRIFHDGGIPYAPRVSPNYNCSSGQMLEYAQHYQNRRDYLIPQMQQELIGKMPASYQQLSEMQPQHSLADPQGGKSGLKQFLENWNDEFADDKGEGEQSLYILGATEIPSENIGEFIHLQVDKLPENIKGYLSTSGSKAAAQNDAQKGKENTGQGQANQAPSVITPPLNLTQHQTQSTQETVIKESGSGISVISETKKFLDGEKSNKSAQASNSVIVFGEHNNAKESKEQSAPDVDLDENQNTVGKKTDSVIKTTTNATSEQCAKSSEPTKIEDVVEDLSPRPKTPGSNLEEIPKPLNEIEHLLDDTSDDSNPLFLPTETTTNIVAKETETTVREQRQMSEKSTQTLDLTDSDPDSDSESEQTRKKPKLDEKMTEDTERTSVKGDKMKIEIAGEVFEIIVTENAGKKLLQILPLTECDISVVNLKQSICQDEQAKVTEESHLDKLENVLREEEKEQIEEETPLIQEEPPLVEEVTQIPLVVDSLQETETEKEINVEEEQPAEQVEEQREEVQVPVEKNDEENTKDEKEVEVQMEMPQLESEIEENKETTQEETIEEHFVEDLQCEEQEQEIGVFEMPQLELCNEVIFNDQCNEVTVGEEEEIETNEIPMDVADLEEAVFIDEEESQDMPEPSPLQTTNDPDEETPEKHEESDDSESIESDVRDSVEELLKKVEEQIQQQQQQELVEQVVEKHQEIEEVCPQEHEVEEMPILKEVIVKLKESDREQVRRHLASKRKRQLTDREEKLKEMVALKKKIAVMKKKAADIPFDEYVPVIRKDGKETKETTTPKKREQPPRRRSDGEPQKPQQNGVHAGADLKTVKRQRTHSHSHSEEPEKKKVKMDKEEEKKEKPAERPKKHDDRRKRSLSSDKDKHIEKAKDKEKEKEKERSRKERLSSTESLKTGLKRHHSEDKPENKHDKTKKREEHTSERRKDIKDPKTDKKDIKVPKVLNEDIHFAPESTKYISKKYNFSVLSKDERTKAKIKTPSARNKKMDSLVEDTIEQQSLSNPPSCLASPQKSKEKDDKDKDPIEDTEKDQSMALDVPAVDVVIDDLPSDLSPTSSAKSMPVKTKAQLKETPSDIIGIEEIVPETEEEAAKLYEINDLAEDSASIKDSPVMLEDPATPNEDSSATDTSRKRLSLEEYKKKRCDKLPSFDEERERREQSSKKQFRIEEDFETLLERALDAPNHSKLNIPQIIETISLKSISTAPPDEEPEKRPIDFIDLEQYNPLKCADPRMKKYERIFQQQHLDRLQHKQVRKVTVIGSQPQDPRRCPVPVPVVNKRIVVTDGEDSRIKVSATANLKRLVPVASLLRQTMVKSSSESASDSSESESSSDSETSHEEKLMEIEKARRGRSSSLQMDLNKEIDNIFSLPLSQLKPIPKPKPKTQFLFNLDEISTNLSLEMQATAPKRKQNVFTEPDDFDGDDQHEDDEFCPRSSASSGGRNLIDLNELLPGRQKKTTQSYQMFSTRCHLKDHTDSSLHRNIFDERDIDAFINKEPPMAPAVRVGLPVVDTEVKIKSEPVVADSESDKAKEIEMPADVEEGEIVEEASPVDVVNAYAIKGDKLKEFIESIEPKKKKKHKRTSLCPSTSEDDGTDTKEDTKEEIDNIQDHSHDMAINSCDREDKQVLEQELIQIEEIRETIEEVCENSDIVSKQDGGDDGHLESEKQEEIQRVEVEQDENVEEEDLPMNLTTSHQTSETISELVPINDNEAIPNHVNVNVDIKEIESESQSVIKANCDSIINYATANNDLKHLNNEHEIINIPKLGEISSDAFTDKLAVNLSDSVSNSDEINQKVDEINQKVDETLNTININNTKVGKPLESTNCVPVVNNKVFINQIDDDDLSDEDISCTIEETKVIIRNLHKQQSKSKGTKDIQQQQQQEQQQPRGKSKETAKKQSDFAGTKKKKLDDISKRLMCDVTGKQAPEKSEPQPQPAHSLNFNLNLDLVPSPYNPSFPYNSALINSTANGAANIDYYQLHQYYQQLQYQHLLYYQQQAQFLHQQHQQELQTRGAEAEGEKQYASVLSNEDLKMKLSLIQPQAHQQASQTQNQHQNQQQNQSLVGQEDRRQRRRRKSKQSSSSNEEEDYSVAVFESQIAHENEGIFKPIPKLIIKRSVSSADGMFAEPKDVLQPVVRIERDPDVELAMQKRKGKK